MKIKSICGIILTTNNMNEMVNFYKNILNLNLVKEEHDGLDFHYGVDLDNNIHFALHPPSNFNQENVGNTTSKIAYEVDSLDEYVTHLKEKGFKPINGVLDQGFGLVASYKDPDNNILELVELKYNF